MIYTCEGKKRSREKLANKNIREKLIKLGREDELLRSQKISRTMRGAFWKVGRPAGTSRMGIHNRGLGDRVSAGR